MIAPGDSGGGLFVPCGQPGRGDDCLVGITSFIGAYDGAANADFGDIAGFVRVSAFNAWIDSVINGLAAAAVDLTGGVPGPATLFGAGPGAGSVGLLVVASDQSGCGNGVCASIAEPAPLALFLLGLGGLLALGRRG